jgi:16S rRNA (guanine527-N7)-methyltransferase
VGLLNPLLELSIPLVKLNGRCMAYKGKKGLEELEKATGALKKLKAQHLLTLTESLPTKHEERILLVFGKLAPSPKDFPRHYSMIKSRPL